MLAPARFLFGSDAHGRQGKPQLLPGQEVSEDADMPLMAVTTTSKKHLSVVGAHGTEHGDPHSPVQPPAQATASRPMPLEPDPPPLRPAEATPPGPLAVLLLGDDWKQRLRTR